MTYDNRQAMTVALYNAGCRGTKGPSSFPFELADAVLANLHSMGWVLDGYLHEQGTKKVQQQYEDEEVSTCGESTCDKPAVGWGMCGLHLKMSAEEGFEPPPRHRGSDWKGDQ